MPLIYHATSLAGNEAAPAAPVSREYGGRCAAAAALGAAYFSNFFSTRIPLWPPKPRLFDMTVFTVAERPSFGT